MGANSPNTWKSLENKDLESSCSLLQSLFYNWRSYLKPFGRGGVVKLWEEKADSLTHLINHKAVSKAAPVFARVCL
jgi:hypothetical protein